MEPPEEFHGFYSHNTPNDEPSLKYEYIKIKKLLPRFINGRLLREYYEVHSNRPWSVKSIRMSPEDALIHIMKNKDD
jgi:hypothetical protein